MTKLLKPSDSDADRALPRTLNEAVDRLALMLISLGMRIRNKFGLWHYNRDLLMDCQRIKYGDAADSYLSMDPDDASGLIIRALWARLRH